MFTLYFHIGLKKKLKNQSKLDYLSTLRGL